jgi:tetratricopeptide (TPR) repeat protein
VSRSDRTRTRRILLEAEGYLELGMPEHTLKSLDRITDPATFRGQALFLRGQALRALRRHREALTHLEDAADLSPSNVQIWLALGWCYKRAGKIHLAIEAMERAIDVQPSMPLLHYNLACYLSLAGEKRGAIRQLAFAIELDDSFRYKVIDEPDFDPLRGDPEFVSLTSIIV